MYKVCTKVLRKILDVYSVIGQSSKVPPKESSGLCPFSH